MKLQLSIKDIFNSDDNFLDELSKPKEANKIAEQIEPKKDTDRMVQLIKSYEQKDEIVKESNSKIIDQEKIKEETERLKHLSVHRTDEAFSGLGGINSNMVSGMGIGQISSVNNNMHIKAQGETVNSFVHNNNQNPNSTKLHNPAFAYLQPAEALRVAIERTLNSGSPINNLGFYEEVNWNLNNMGFPAKLPLDIKQATLNLTKD